FLAVGVTALDHETGDDAMELGSIIKTGARQFEKILNMVGRDFGEKFEGDVAVACGQDSLCHEGKDTKGWRGSVGSRCARVRSPRTHVPCMRHAVRCKLTVFTLAGTRASARHPHRCRCSSLCG